MHEAFELGDGTEGAGIVMVIPGRSLASTCRRPRRRTSARTRPFDGYDDFLAALIDETRGFAGQVVLVHGDTHYFKVDKPLLDQAHLIPNFTRLETFGSPNVHWVRVSVDPASREVFSSTR